MGHGVRGLGSCDRIEGSQNADLATVVHGRVTKGEDFKFQRTQYGMDANPGKASAEPKVEVVMVEAFPQDRLTGMQGQPDQFVRDELDHRFIGIEVESPLGGAKRLQERYSPLPVLAPQARRYGSDCSLSTVHFQ